MPDSLRLRVLQAFAEACKVEAQGGPPVAELCKPGELEDESDEADPHGVGKFTFHRSARALALAPDAPGPPARLPCPRPRVCLDRSPACPACLTVACHGSPRALCRFAPLARSLQHGADLRPAPRSCGIEEYKPCMKIGTFEVSTSRRYI